MKLAFDFPRLYKILLVENDEDSARVIRAGMRQYKCLFEHCLTAAEVFERKDVKGFDIIILDVGLSGDMDGIECCAKLRRIGYSGGVLFLTKRGDETTRVLSLSSGGDAYLAKPFSAEEFLAMIQALSKKLEEAKQKGKEKLQAGNVALDKGLYKLTVGEDAYYLPAKEFMILEILMENKGKAVPREKILSVVWGNESNDLLSNSLDVHIGRLRRKLGKSYIKTIRGKGYSFVVS